MGSSTVDKLQAFTEALSILGSDSAYSPTRRDEARNVGILFKKSQPRKINCSYACSRRCRESSRKNVCKRACKSCCARCHCVPPGTYGNKGACPCYASLRTHGNKLKCP
ncbi:unnamed protein product [Fraxinus pennsylvanica]|uniref:Uncharacterized protein n=1 Tax=Fraxinus pennsylvanica TaxID=56036 RepID=A0AAD2AFB8_9LAMI|nr:unnamed protein product [Fraxinus pennsylvanica]